MSSSEKYYQYNFKNSPFGKKKVTDYKKMLKYSIAFGIALFIFYSIKSKIDNISKIQNEIISNRDLIESIKKREEALNQGISICKRELEKLNNENKNLNEKKIVIKYENEKLEKNKNENPQSEKVKIDENISKKKKELNELTNKYNDLEKQYKEIITEKENSLKEIGKLENDIKDLEKKYKEEQIIKEKELKYNSKIIENDKEYLIFRNSYSIKSYNIQLLYRLSRDGSSISSFHNKVKDTKKTLILLLLKDGNKIGGFTSQSWNNNGFQFDYYSYLFSIPLSKKYLIQIPNTAIFSTLNEFICFGNGDLKIYPDKITSEFPSSYSYKSNKLELTNGKSYVELVEMEVYKVID